MGEAMNKPETTTEMRAETPRLPAHTGMRRGELLSLRWSQVAGQRHTIKIMNAKTSSGNRFIPLNDTARRVLMELGQARSSEYVFPGRRKPGDRLLDLKKGFKAAVRFAEIRDIIVGFMTCVTRSQRGSCVQELT